MATAAIPQYERDQMAVAHLSLVRSIAWKIHRRLPAHVPFEDIYGAGVIGLMDALKRFDPGKNRKFSTFAYGRIRGAIIDNLRVLDPAPRKLRKLGRDIEEATQALTAQHGRMPNSFEIARRLNITMVEYHRAIRRLNDHGEASLHDEDNLVDTLQDPGDDPLTCCLEHEKRDLAIEAIAHLPEAERLVIMLYYFDELTMEEIGAVLDVTESRISQLHLVAIQRLRERLTGTPEAESSCPRPRQRSRNPRLPARTCAGASLPLPGQHRTPSCMA